MMFFLETMEVHSYCMHYNHYLLIQFNSHNKRLHKNINSVLYDVALYFDIIYHAILNIMHEKHNY